MPQCLGCLTAALLLVLVAALADAEHAAQAPDGQCSVSSSGAAEQDAADSLSSLMQMPQRLQSKSSSLASTAGGKVQPLSGRGLTSRSACSEPIKDAYSMWKSCKSQARPRAHLNRSVHVSLMALAAGDDGDWGPVPEPVQPTCLANGLATVVVGMLGLVLATICWNAASWRHKEPAEAVEASEPASLTGHLWNYLLTVCMWLALHAAAVAYAAHVTTPRTAALVACSATSAASLYSLRPGGVVASKRWSLMKKAVGLQAPDALVMLVMQVVIFVSVWHPGSAGLQFAWGLSMLAALLSVYLICVQSLELQNFSAASSSMHAGHVVLLLSLTYAFDSGLEPCWVPPEDQFSIEYNQAAALSFAAYIVLLRWMTSSVHGDAVRRFVFLGIACILATPALAALTGRNFVLGLWGMFSGEWHDSQLTPEGYAVASLGAAVAVALATTQEGLGLGWSREGPLPTLALVRVLLPFWLLASITWGDNLPVLDWYYPLLGPTGRAVSKLVICLALLALLLGVRARLAATALAACWAIGFTQPDSSHDCPAQFTAMVLFILAYTPCDSCFSVRALAESYGVQWQTLLGTGELNDSPWAKSLLRLHASVLYFWAAMFKVNPYWLGGLAFRDMGILEESPLHSVLDLFLRTEELRHAARVGLSWAAVGLELSLSLSLWSKRLHVYAVPTAACMHLGMNLLCGRLGGFSQACWIGLIGCLDSERVETILKDPRHFAIAVLAVTLVMSWIGNKIEEF